MKIIRIFAHRVELPLVEGTYKWSGGKSVSVFDSTIVGVETDTGLVGYGEVCPLGPFYLPAYAEGVRCGIRELAPHLIGYDPRELTKLNHRMDAALKGHPYVKSGIDIACWDLLGLSTGLPVCVLMGGRFGDNVRLYRAISQEAPEQMAAKVAGLLYFFKNFIFTTQLRRGSLLFSSGLVVTSASPTIAFEVIDS